MNVFVFPGQGAQFPGMGLDAYNSSNKIKELFEFLLEPIEVAIIFFFLSSNVAILGSAADISPVIFFPSLIPVYENVAINLY